MQANFREDALSNFRAQGHPQQGPSVHDLPGQNAENSGDCGQRERGDRCDERTEEVY